MTGPNSRHDSQLQPPEIAGAQVLAAEQETAVRYCMVAACGRELGPSEGYHHDGLGEDLCAACYGEWEVAR